MLQLFFGKRRPIDQSGERLSQLVVSVDPTWPRVPTTCLLLEKAQGRGMITQQTYRKKKGFF